MVEGGVEVGAWIEQVPQEDLPLPGLGGIGGQASCLAWQSESHLWHLVCGWRSISRIRGCDDAGSSFMRTCGSSGASEVLLD